MTTKPFKVNSIAVPLVGTNYLRDGGDLMPMDQFIGSMKATGFNDVRIITTSGVLARYNDIAYDPILTARFEPTDSEVLSFATRLKSEGFTVTWSPFIGLSGEVTGSGSGGDKANPSNFDAWFENHKAAMVHEARLAQAAGAERFVVFTDDVQNLLYSPPGSAKAAKWLELVTAIRGVYSGELTSILFSDGTLFPGGNNHLQLIPRTVLDALDTIGVGLFPDPLTNKTNPSVDELINAWYSNAQGVRSVDLLKSISDFYGKKVWVSDRTFHSFDGANIDHGQVLRTNPPLVPDQQEQADLMDSFLRVMSLEQGTWFNGVSLQNWNRFPDYTSGVARFLDSAVGENFQGKLAEQVVNSWFNGLKQSVGITRSGTAQADRLEGGYHHDALTGLGGNDTIEGGAGLDTAVFTGLRASYSITNNSTGITVTSTEEGTDTLTNVERLVFRDERVAYDTAGSAGAAALMLGAVAGKASLQNKALVGSVLNLVDAGANLSKLAELAVSSGIVANLAGGADNLSFAKLLMRNIMGSNPDAVVADTVAGLVTSGAYTQASLLTTAAALDLNKTNIDLVGLAQTGLTYSVA